MKGKISRIAIRTHFSSHKEHNRGTLWIWKIFLPPHPLQIFKEDKRDIQDFGEKMENYEPKWNFPFREPDQRGDHVDFGNFSTHTIPYVFSTFIREIFKILWKR